MAQPSSVVLLGICERETSKTAQIHHHICSIGAPLLSTVSSCPTGFTRACPSIALPCLGLLSCHCSRRVSGVSFCLVEMNVRLLRFDNKSGYTLWSFGNASRLLDQQSQVHIEKGNQDGVPGHGDGIREEVLKRSTAPKEWSRG